MGTCIMGGIPQSQFGKRPEQEGDRRAGLGRDRLVKRCDIWRKDSGTIVNVVRLVNAVRLRLAIESSNCIQ